MASDSIGSSVFIIIRFHFEKTDNSFDLCQKLKLHKMKRLYHIIITSHEEVVRRDEEDIRNATNLLALAAFRTETEILADSIMSTHLHTVVASENPLAFIRSYRMSYTKYFNHKYGRTGRLGEKKIYVLELDGLNHIVTCISYVLKNGVHHLQSPTAFSYRDCTAPFLFMKELGKARPNGILTNIDDIKRHLPRVREIPKNYVMSSDGYFLRDSFEDVLRVEGYFGKVNNFLHKMAMSPSDQRWENEQLSEDTRTPLITLEVLERGFSDEDIIAMKKKGDGYYYRPSAPTDLDICKYIDNQLLPQGKTVYSITDKQKIFYLNLLLRTKQIPLAQAKRCLAIKEKSDKK